MTVSANVRGCSHHLLSRIHSGLSPGSGLRGIPVDVCRAQSSQETGDIGVGKAEEEWKEELEKIKETIKNLIISPNIIKY